MKKYIITLGIVCLFSLQAFAQAQMDIVPTQDTEQEVTFPCTARGTFYDSGRENPYSANEYYQINIKKSTSDPNLGMAITFDEFDVYDDDTLFIYDGPIVDPMFLMPIGEAGLLYANNSNSLKGRTIHPSSQNISGNLIFLFKSGSARPTNPAQGWKATIRCQSVCVGFTVTLDDDFYKYVNGEKVPQKIKRDAIEYTDTVTGETIYYDALDFCKGDTIMLSAKTSFVNNTSQQPDDLNTKFRWNFGIGPVDSSGSSVTYKYTRANPYILRLVAENMNKCIARVKSGVRIADNPIRMVAAIPDLCTGESIEVVTGYAGGSLIRIDSMKKQNPERKIEIDTTFLPDGPYCDKQCFNSSIVFDQYPSDMKIESEDDINSICITMEHTYVGDLGMYLVCPTGQKATLMTYLGNDCNNYIQYPNLPILPPLTQCANTSASAKLGRPVERPVEGMPPPDECTRERNKSGIGWQYCWSSKNEYLNNNQGRIGQAARTRPGATLDSANFQSKTRFFMPDSSFAALKGCPLNGEWSVQVCDYYKSDKGYIFNWSMELSGAAADVPWSYSVGLEKALFDGPFIDENATTNTSTVITPQEGGTHTYNISVIDSFGCVWDTVTHLRVVQTPKVSLVQDTSAGPLTICVGTTSLLLDCGVPDTNEYPNKYEWEPIRGDGPTITVPSSLAKTTTFRVRVTSFNENIPCSTDDTVVVYVSPSPTPSFAPEKFPLEGCEPFEIKLENTSAFSDLYTWDFGDGTTSNEISPSHTYEKSGLYDIMLRAENSYGCTDSIYYKELIRVFSSPKAEFSWEPRYPTLLDPTVKFKNLSTPQSAENIYTWKIQDNLSDSLSTTPIFGETHPYHTFPTEKGAEVSGVYTVKLISKTINEPPSGYIYECVDTATHTITLLNDFLQFPNVVTANGDGVNDVFRITNMGKHTAFPKNELHIYNRYGKTMYHKKDMTENDVWDPKAEKAPTGTYFYKFVVKGYYKDQEYNGIIEVLGN